MGSRHHRSTPTPGVIDIGVSGKGALTAPGNLTISMTACSARWVGDTCPGIQEAWLPPQDLANAIETSNPDGVRRVGAMPSDQQRWLRMLVTLTGQNTPSGARADVQIHASGAGEDVSTGKSAGATLARTGSSGIPLALTGAAILLGLGAATLARQSRRRTPRSS